MIAVRNSFMSAAAAVLVTAIRDRAGVSAAHARILGIHVELVFIHMSPCTSACAHREGNIDAHCALGGVAALNSMLVCVFLMNLVVHRMVLLWV